MVNVFLVSVQFCESRDFFFGGGGVNLLVVKPFLTFPVYDKFPARIVGIKRSSKEVKFIFLP